MCSQKTFRKVKKMCCLFLIRPFCKNTVNLGPELLSLFRADGML